MFLRLFFVYWLPVLLYGGTIVMFSSMSTPQIYFPGWVQGVNDKILHTLEYAVLAILCYRAFLYAAGPRLRDLAGMLAMAGAILFGVSDELHQYFVPLRDADPWDLVANAAGSLIGVTCWQKISQSLRVIQTS